MVNKKGYFQFVEIALVILLTTTFFFVFFPKAEMTFQNTQDLNGLEKTGFGVLKSLDECGIFSSYIPMTSMAISNFTAMKLYIKTSLPATVDSRIEYATSSTECYSEDGALGNCGLNLNENLTKKFDVVRADYTYSRRAEPVTIHLFLWRIL